MQETVTDAKPFSLLTGFFDLLCGSGQPGLKARPTPRRRSGVAKCDSLGGVHRAFELMNVKPHRNQQKSAAIKTTKGGTHVPTTQAS